jgi:hypothetical protein
MTAEADSVKVGEKLLAKARRAGLIVYQQGPELMMEGPSDVLARLKEVLLDAKGDVPAARAHSTRWSNSCGPMPRSWYRASRSAVSFTWPT